MEKQSIYHFLVEGVCYCCSDSW